jgi:hypothetical protein
MYFGLVFFLLKKPIYKRNFGLRPGSRSRWLGPKSASDFIRLYFFNGTSTLRGVCFFRENGNLLKKMVLPN